MNRLKSRFFSIIFASVFILSCIFSGCTKNQSPKKIQNIDFTIISGSDVPGDLKKIIKDRKKDAFQLTYTDGSMLYICKGYGHQKTSGYNIVVHDFYQSSEGLVFHTELFGPKSDETVSASSSYPYIVIKTEYRKDPVIFEE